LEHAKNRELTNCGSWSSARADRSIGRAWPKVFH
jgi:hypothetical protein